MTKEQLRNYQPMKKEQRQIEQRLRNLERSPESDQEALQPLRECYTKKLEELVAAQLEIESAIGTLEDPTERTILRLRYIDGLSWYKIMATINYSEQQTHRIYARALINLKNL